MLEIKGDMRDWLGKGAKGEVAVRELAAQKERTKATEMKVTFFSFPYGQLV